MHPRRSIPAVALWLAVSLLGCAAKQAQQQEDTAARTFLFTYSLVVNDIPEGAHTLSLWVPVPRTDRHQEVLDLQVTCPLEYQITQEKHYGNRVLHLSAKAPLPRTLELQFAARVARQAYNVLSDKHAGADPRPPEADDLQANALVPIDGIIASLASQVTRDATTPIDKARAIYDYVTTTMTYDKSGQGWGRGDALYACDARKGNCTDFHSLIIGLARASGIPARFVMGFPLPEDKTSGEIPGYHCWAEMYVEGIGWLPVDSSEASKHPEKREAFFGGLDANRVEFTRGRDLQLEPPAATRLNFFVYPYVEVDGTQHEQVQRSFSFSELKT
ncbi:MAG TPA: transglutaminase domain-containing protein [Candidatus Krumholzibacteria bacterium]|nr:transglutaminase domain-containing protein [Candidatus Krumholzibacteria bacterium]